MRNALLGLCFLVLFGVVVVSYPAYADNDLAVVAVVAALLGAGLGGIILSGQGGSRWPESP
jgi:drug/metabolite transporter (DMT)-like permease